MDKLSSNWQVKSLGEAVGKSFLMIDGDWVESKDQDPNGEIRLIQLADVGDGEYLNVSKKFLTRGKAIELKCTILEEGDLLLARMPDPLGRACIFPGDEKDCVTVVDVSIIRPDKKNVHNEFLKYQINSSEFRSSLKRYISGTTRARISRSNLEKIKVSIPPLPIQKQIAEILKKADAAKQKRKEANKLANEFLQSVFIEMFGDPIKNPKGWEVKNFYEITEIVMGQSPDGNSYNITGKGLPLLNGPAEFGETYPKEIQWTTQPTKFSKQGDILFCVRGATAGRMNWSDKEYCIGRGLAAIRSNHKSKIEFIYHFLKLKYSQFQKLGQGSTFINLSKELIAMMKIPVPPINLQQQFAYIVNKTEALKEKQKQSERELENLFQSLMQKAFKGELV